MLSITNIIIAINVVMSLIAFSNKEKFDQWKLNPYMVKHKGSWWRIFSHAFIHADYLHLFFNMYVLYSFGNNALEMFLCNPVTSNYLGFDLWNESIITPFGYLKGVIVFLSIYIGGILASSLPALIKHGEHHYYNSVGASGAVSSVLFASIIIFPTSKLGILFLPFEIPAFIFGALYLAFEYYMDKKGGENRIAHDAHFWGGVFGIVFLLIIKPTLFVNFVDQIGVYFQNILS